MKHQIPWLRVAVEGFVIVASILSAFAVDAWWDASQQRQDEFASLQLLERDQAEAIQILESFVVLTEDRAAAALGAYKALSGPTDLDRIETTRLLMAATGLRTLRIPSAAYTDLLSTGNLRLIRDEEVRDAVVGFYEAANRSLDIIERNQTTAYAGLVQSFVDDGLVTVRPGSTITGTPGLDTVIDEFFETELGSGVVFPEDRLWSLPPDSREWRSLQTALTSAAMNLVISAEIARQTADAARRLQGMLEAQLSGR